MYFTPITVVTNFLHCFSFIKAEISHVCSDEAKAHPAFNICNHLFLHACNGNTLIFNYFQWEKKSFIHQLSDFFYPTLEAHISQKLLVQFWHVLTTK